MLEQLKKEINDAELVLIGIGEGCETIQKSSEIQGKIRQMYGVLHQLIEGKNYFIVSTCMDGLIHKQAFDEKKIVEPCGNFRKLQCIDNCNHKVIELSQAQIQQIEELLENGELPENISNDQCEECGKKLVFNNLFAENYAEEGYLAQWEIYTKWLQGTVNRKVCILELGVGMQFPTVIRWPFEKVAFFNQKAKFFRVNKTLYQVTEEIKERSYSIAKAPYELLK